MKLIWASFFHTKRVTFLQFEKEHKCKLLLEDVVDNDIKGNTLLDKLRRLWYNMILVDYNNPSAKIFYLSKYTILRERRRQYNYYKNCFHPWSLLRQWWGSLVAVCVFLNTFTITLTFSELYADDTMFLRPINVLLEFIIIADIFVHFNTGYPEAEKKRVVFDHHKIFLNYLSTKIFLHVLTALPLQFFAYAAEMKLEPSVKNKYCPNQKVPCIPSVFISFLRILSGLRILRLFDITDSWKLTARRFPTCYPSNWRFVHVFLISFLAINQSSNISHAVTQWLGQESGGIDGDSLLAQYYTVKLRGYDVFFLEKSNLLKIFLVTTQGYYRLFTLMDRIAITMNYLIGMTYMIWCGLEFISRMDVDNQRNQSMQSFTDEAKSYMKRRRLPLRLKERVLEYFNYIEFTSTPLRKNDLFNSLPQSIKDEIQVASKRHLLKNLDIFSNWPDNVIDEMTVLLKQDVFLSGDTVAYINTMNDSLSIIEHGIVAKYLMDGEELNRLGDGEYFGEMCLVTPEDVHLVEIVAVSNSCIVSLTKSDFTEVISPYPDLVKELRANLIEIPSRDISSTSKSDENTEIKLG